MLEGFTCAVAGTDPRKTAVARRLHKVAAGIEKSASQTRSNTLALAPPFCVGPNRIWPREKIAEIKRMRWSARGCNKGRFAASQCTTADARIKFKHLYPSS